MRSDWTSRAHQLVMDVGPLGCRVTGAHGHADLLSVPCSVFGEPCVVDPGTYCYTADRGWRDHFRGTAAHSTVMIDGLPQAHPTGPFTWRSRPAVTIQEWVSTDAVDLVDAYHDAYADLPDAVRHRRRVLFVKPRFWILVDDLTGSAEHDVEIRFQFATRHVEPREGSWVAVRGRRGEGLWVAPFSTAPISARVVEGELNPPQGWVSSHYGRKHPAPILVYATRRTLPARIVTLLLPAERLQATPPRVTVTHGADGRTMSLRLHDSNEVVHVTDDALTVAPAPDGAQERR